MHHPIFCHTYVLNENEYLLTPPLLLLLLLFKFNERFLIYLLADWVLSFLFFLQGLLLNRNLSFVHLFRLGMIINQRFKVFSQISRCFTVRIEFSNLPH